MLIGAAAGVAVGAAAITIGAGTGLVANLGQFVQDFVKSPGLGGLAALGAAALAYRGIRGQIQTSRDALENQQNADKASRWWATFQWTADRALPSGAEDVALPKPVAITTLQELATTATDDAQRIACSGLVDVLGDHGEEAMSPDAPVDDGPFDTAGAAARVFLSTAAKLQADSLDAALSNYAMATRGSRAESSIARRSAYESKTREAIAEIAKDAGLIYESTSDGLFADPLDERYWADGIIYGPGGEQTLVEVIAYERAGARIVERLLTIAANEKYPVVIVAPVPLPEFMRDRLRSPDHWIRWNPGEELSSLRESILRVVA